MQTAVTLTVTVSLPDGAPDTEVKTVAHDEMHKLLHEGCDLTIIGPPADPTVQLMAEVEAIKNSIELASYKMAVDGYHDAFDGLDKALLIGMTHPTDALAAIASIVTAVEPIINTLRKDQT